MNIKYLGMNSFLLKGKNAGVLIDPFDPKTVGLSWRSVEAEIVISTNPEIPAHNNFEGAKNAKYEVKGPGEYEINEVMILGYPVQGSNKDGKTTTIYKIEIDDVKICNLGDIHDKISADLAEELGNIDILMLPVGGNDHLNAREAADLVNKLEPRIVIPTTFDDKSGKLKIQLDPVDKFVEALGANYDGTPVDVLKVTSADFSDEEEGVRLIVMKSA